MNETLTLSAGALVANSSPSGFSLLYWLPKSKFTEFLISLNFHLSQSISNVLPHKWFLQPLIYDPLATLFVMFLIAITFTFFVDFLLHAWKIPFAMIVDILAVAGLANPLFNIFAGLGSIIVFSLLARNASKYWRLGFIIGGVFKAFTPQLTLIPLNTIMMLIVTIL